MSVFKHSRYRSAPTHRIQTGAGRVGEVFQPRTTARESKSASSYTVREGETIFELARRFYDDARLWWVLADHNPHIFYPMDLKQGDVLNVPSLLVARMQ